MRYIDIGVNLFDKQFKNRENKLVEEAHNENIQIIITGSSIKSSILASNYTKNKKDIYCTVGVHPHSAKTCDEHTLNTLKELAESNSNVVAIGECGLDYDRMFSPKNIQLEWFEKQIRLAEELKLPLFLHERAAADDFYRLMKKHKEICNHSVVHCFTGTKETALQYLNLGCFIGITGWICDDRRNKDLLEAIKIIPSERIMIETDAPYLTPKNIPELDRTNIPQNIKYVAERIAKEKNMNLDVFINKVYENTFKFFQLKSR